MTIWTTTSMPDLVDGQDYSAASYFNALRDLALTHCGYAYLPTTAPTGFSGNLLAAYQFDGSVNSLSDRSGNGNNLVISLGTESHETIGGLVGLSFNGATAAGASANADLQRTGAITIEAIFRPNRIGSSVQKIMGCGYGDAETSATNYLWWMTLDNATNRIQYGQENGSGVDSSGTTNQAALVGQTQHCLIARNSAGTTQTVYLHGEQISQTTGMTVGSGGTSGTLQFGGNIGASSAFHYFHGHIFSARVWDDEMNSTHAALAYAQARQMAAVS